MARSLILCVLLLFAYGCSSDSADEAATSANPEASTPVETITPGPAESELANALDLPLYPGSKVVRNDLVTRGAVKRYRVELETNDDAKKIAEFYGKAGLELEVRGDRAEFMGNTKKGNSVILQVDRKDDTSQIMIRVSPATR